MANFDDMFGSVKKSEENETKKNTPFDKVSWAEQKQLERESAYTMMADMAERISEDGNALKTYLDVQTQFNRYSVGNALLVAAQKPESTRLADFDFWKSEETSILKGETGIMLLEPGEEYTKEDGTTGVSFNVKKVFDISQTTEKDSVKAPHKKDERGVIKSLVDCAPCEIKISDKVSADVGSTYDTNDKVIYICQGMVADRIICSLSREIAAVRMMDMKDNGNRAFDAYCVSYIFAKKAGVDVSKYNFDKLPENFKFMEAADIRAELSNIHDTAKDMIAEMYKVLEQNKASKNRDEAR